MHKLIDINRKQCGNHCTILIAYIINEIMTDDNENRIYYGRNGT